MNDKPVGILWDNGANISVTSKEYVNNVFLHVAIKNLHNILTNVDKLQVRWRNQEILQYKGRKIGSIIGQKHYNKWDPCTLFNYSRKVTLPNTYNRTQITKLPIKIS